MKICFVCERKWLENPLDRTRFIEDRFVTDGIKHIMSLKPNPYARFRDATMLCGIILINKEGVWHEGWGSSYHL